MGISGCTSCQVGGLEALRAYDRAFEVRRDTEAKQAKKADEARKAEKAAETGQTQQTNPTQSIYENRPTADSTVGSVINISA
jgi:hypothetical protein